MISRRKFLKSTAASATAAAVPATLAAAHGKTNVLFIGVDDLNHSLGCYGQPVETPHLDALAARGARFDAAYCQYPLCAPSRNSLLSGLAPDTTGAFSMQNPLRDFVPDVVTLPQLFRKNGYYAARVGKIYHARDPLDEGLPGEDDPQSWDYTFNNAGVDRTKELEKCVALEPHPEGTLGDQLAAYQSPAGDRQITDGVGADEVIRLLKENKDKPFFLAYGLYRPHLPWIVPEEYFKRYPVEKIHAEPLDPGELTMAPAVAYNKPVPNHGMTEEQARQCKAAYYASTTYIDAQIGRVLSTLKDLGLEKNTLVVFWADHGWQLGQHGQWEKMTLFEWSARVPFILAGPGVPKGRVIEQTTEHLDVYPTLVELCKLQNAPPLQGKSMTTLLSGSGKSVWDKPAMTQIHRQQGTQGYSLRTKRYRYTQWIAKAEEVIGEELYDYQTDPRETHNRAKDAEMTDVKATLRAQLTEVRKTRQPDKTT